MINPDRHTSLSRDDVLNLAPIDYPVVQKRHEGVAVQLAQDNPGNLVKPVVFFQIKYKIHNGSCDCEHAGFDSQSDN